MTKSKAHAAIVYPGSASTSSRLVNTTRASWMANNAIPDSIITDIMCWSMVFSVELPNVRSTEVDLTPLNTLRILNTIKPVTRAFVTMEATKPVRTNVIYQGAYNNWPCSTVTAPCDASQVAKVDKSISVYQIKLNSDWLTKVCDCQEWRNNHDTDIFIPQDPTTVYLWRFRWIKQMIT